VLGSDRQVLPLDEWRRLASIVGNS
jgi:hypothetical protein